ncbi:MAG: OsmC family protein, partial [Thermoproteota archaeon]|nr:OsmC family protein [Thermoproteota archaeon]
IDEVSDLAGVDTAQNPVETLLAALGACIMITFVYNATLRNIEIENLEIALEGQIENILVFLGLEKDGNPGFNNIKIDIYVKSNAEKEIIEEIVKESINASPVAATLTRNVNLIHKVKIF